MTLDGAPDLEKFCGVETVILEEFFNLLKVAYPLIDKANYFIEIEEGISGINISITNERDALSHFYTIISNPDLTYEDRKGQLSTAEEHLRRAILEPYCKAISILLDEHVIKLYHAYREKVIPLKASETSLSAAPTMEQIDKKMEVINKARASARDAKRRNKIDDEWIQGVQHLIEAFQSVKKLRSELKDYVMQAEQLEAFARQSKVNATLQKESKTHLKLGWTHVILVIASCIAVFFVEHYIWPIIMPSHPIQAQQIEQGQQPSNKAQSK